MIQQLPGRSGLDHFAGIHHGHPVTYSGHHAKVMGDVKDRQLPFPLDVFQQRRVGRLDRHVQGRGGLVGDEHLGFARESDGTHHPLPHAAAELVGVVFQSLLGCGDAQQPEKFYRPPFQAPAAQVLMQAQGFRELIIDIEYRVQADIGSWSIMAMRLPL